MAGEIATAYVALVPSMKNFGSQAAQQIGPQARTLGRKLGEQAGAEFSTAAAKGSAGWFAQTAKGAIKNVTLYGSMYAAIQAVQKGIGAVLESMVGFNAEIEQATVGFETLLGSSAAAGEQMQWIKEFARETPFQYKDLVGYSQQLLALGFNAEQSRDVLQATGDAAAALGRGSESIARINLALGQMWTKGKVQSQEMLQLTEAGIGGWQILAEAYGTSVEQVQEAVTNGLIKAKDAVPLLLEGMNTRFGGLMEKQSKTFAGVLSNIQDTLQQQLAEAGEPLFAALKDEAGEFLEALNDPEGAEMMEDLGRTLAKAVEVLATGAKLAYDFRDAILAIGIAYGSVKLISKVQRDGMFGFGGSGSGGAGGALTTIREYRAATALATTATLAATNAEAAHATVVAQSQTATMNANRALIERVAATEALAVAEAQLVVAEGNEVAWNARVIGSDGQVTAATTARMAATERLALAQSALVVADLEVALSARAVAAAQQAAALASTEAAAAAAKAAAAQQKMAGLKATAGMIGQVAGLAGLVIGYQQISSAQGDAAKTAIGFAAAIGGGAVAGLALAGPVGAAAGAVVGLAASMWSYSQAAQAANKDTTAIQKALQDLGVDAGLASAALAGVTNNQLEVAGGAQAMLHAMQTGTLDEYVAKLKEQSAAMHEQVDGVAEVVDAYGNYQGTLGDTARNVLELDDLIANLTNNSGAFAQSQADITASAYEAAYAMDMQTGSLGTMTQAAWDAVVAQGGLGAEALYASARMEGLAGVAGYATQMLAGIPANTPINFTTNASEILQKIIALQSAVGANANLQAATAGRKAELEAELNRVLAAAKTTVALPTGGGKAPKGGGGSAASAAKARAQQAAEEAARKLEQDRNAQRRFGEAFGSIMEAALEGDFDEYRDRLAEQIKSLTENGYEKGAAALKTLSATLTVAVKDYAALTNKLEAATKAYDELTESMLDQYNTSRDLILGLGQVTDAQSFDQLAYLLGETTSRAMDYQSVLKSLKDQGLNEDLWNQLAQAGPESMALAESILAQGQEGIAQLNSLSAGLVGAADSMGSLVADSMYAQGVKAMEAYIAGLESQSAALENQLGIIGNNVLTQTAGAITPGNAGYTPINTAPQQTVNEYNLSVSAESLGDLKSVQDFIRMLEQAPTTQLVNQAGTVTS